MKNGTVDDKNTRPTLDKLESNDTKHPIGNLAEGLDKLADAKFSTDELEYVFQLMEDQLRKTDSIAVKTALEKFKEANPNRWKVVFERSRNIESGKITSVVSHQLIALIELVSEG